MCSVIELAPESVNRLDLIVLSEMRSAVDTHAEMTVFKPNDSFSNVIDAAGCKRDLRVCRRFHISRRLISAKIRRHAKVILQKVNREEHKEVNTPKITGKCPNTST